MAHIPSPPSSHDITIYYCLPCKLMASTPMISFVTSIFLYRKCFVTSIFLYRRCSGAFCIYFFLFIFGIFETEFFIRAVPRIKLSEYLSIFIWIFQTYSCHALFVKSKKTVTFPRLFLDLKHNNIEYLKRQWTVYPDPFFGLPFPPNSIITT